jgi:hypothetical protein
MKDPTPSSAATRSRLLWAAAIALSSSVVLVAAEWHGRASRVAVQAPRALGARPVAAVGDAAEAFLVWQGSGANGRRVVLLTGQWAGSRRATAPRRDPEAPPAPLGSGAAGDPLHAGSAAYWAARQGLARGVDVVMPPGAFQRQAAADAGHKMFRPEDGAYRHDLHGFRIRFSQPGTFQPPGEPVLVLVEPSWFAPGAPADPLAWLASRGVRTDLALVALDDPGAGDEERRAAAGYVQASRVPRLDLVRTP